MLLYQSNVWRKINEDVFGRNIWEIRLNNSVRWGITKTKKFKSFNFNIYQLLGIKTELIKDHLSQEVQYLSNKVLTNWKDIYLQVGWVNEVDRCPSKLLRKTWKCESMATQKKKINDLITKVGLKKSFYQNMPEATVEINLRNSEAMLLKDISTTSQRYIRRYEKQKLMFEKISEEDEVIKFWKLWDQMAHKKNIYIWPQTTFIDLVSLLDQKNRWWLFVAKTLSGDVAFGSVMIFLDGRAVYLYGALNPNYPWSSYWFMWQFILRAKQKWFKMFDLLGVSSILSLKSHSWTDVSRFKYSLGGEHVEYVGNFDIVHNALLYEAAKIFKNLK